MFRLDSYAKKIIVDSFKQDEFIKNPTCYVYDLSKIQMNLDTLKKNCPSQISLYYAMKANNSPEIMDFICKNDFVSGIEIASSGELSQALEYVKSKNIIFTGPGKTDFELESAILKKIRFINIESVAEAIRINNLAKKHNIKNVNVLVRINLNYSISDATEHMCGRSTKMGIDEKDTIESVRIIDALEHVKVKGIHVFAASGVLSYESLIKSNKYIFDLVEKLESKKINISVIDFGGGLGIDYTDKNRRFNVRKYYMELEKLIRRYKFQKKEIIMELGTYVVGNSGYYASKIIDIKAIKGKKHIILAGGVNHMGLPLEMRRKHPVSIIHMKEKKLYKEQPFISKEVIDISGPLCMVTDILCWDEYIDSANIGDIVVFSQAGAYCLQEGMHSFLSHMLPNMILINEKRKKI